MSNTHKLIIKKLGSLVSREWIRLSDGQIETDTVIIAQLESALTSGCCDDIKQREVCVVLSDGSVTRAIRKYTEDCQGLETVINYISYPDYSVITTIIDSEIDCCSDTIELPNPFAVNDTIVGINPPNIPAVVNVSTNDTPCETSQEPTTYILTPSSVINATVTPSVSTDGNFNVTPLNNGDYSFEYEIYCNGQPSGAIATVNGVAGTPENPSVDLVKSTNDDLTGLSVGDPITYSFTVTNTGNTSLTNISIADNKVSVNCPSNTLAIGDSFICSGTYILTQADIDAGELINIATVVTESPSGTIVTDSDGVTLTANNPDFQVTSDDCPFIDISLTNQGNGAVITLQTAQCALLTDYLGPLLTIGGPTSDVKIKYSGAQVAPDVEFIIPANLVYQLVWNGVGSIGLIAQWADIGSPITNQVYTGYTQVDVEIL